MQDNDIAKGVVARDVLVFEGLLGIFADDTAAARYARLSARGKWDKALACFSINEVLANQIWRVVWEYGVEIDLLTYQGKKFRDRLEVRMEAENFPFGRILYENPQVFARSLIYQPDIRSVYDPYPEHQFLYGGKGRIISSSQATQFGVL